MEWVHYVSKTDKPGSRGRRKEKNGEVDYDGRINSLPAGLLCIVQW